MNDTEERTPRPEAENTAEDAQRLAGLDLAGSIAVFCFGGFVFFSGLHMCFFAATGTKVWYYSPGFFPCFVGAVLMLTSLLLTVQMLRRGARPGNIFRGAASAALRQERFRLLLAVGLFALYVFVLIGTLPFVLATFVYLAVTMILFRKAHYPVWKLLLISAIVTGAVYLFFGVIASVPLP